jgi:signal transduction histidine kinase
MLAQSAMQKHNGTIEVRSEQGQGTTFVCIFPSPPTREARA